MVWISQDVRSGPAGSVRESDRYRPGRGPQAGPAGSQEAAGGPGPVPGQLQCGEAGSSEPGSTSDLMDLQVQTNKTLTHNDPDCPGSEPARLSVSFQAELISERLVVFVCSTTGEGDPPDNMKV